jgi:hypothetical protein
MLGQVVKSQGFRLEIVDGYDLVHTRMYNNLSEVWNGWTKNAVAGLGKRWYLLPASVLGTFAVILYLGLALGSGLRAAMPLWAVALNAVTLLYGALFVGFVRWRLGKMFGQSGWYAFTYPLGLAFAVTIGLASFLGNLFGYHPQWKGRRLSTAKNG